MKSVLLLMTGLPILLCTQCHNEYNNSGPREVLVGFLEKLSKKNFEGAQYLATEKHRRSVLAVKVFYDEGSRKGSPGKMPDLEKEFRNMKIGEAHITGDSATVHVNSGEYSMDVRLKLEKGAWRVDGIPMMP